ncbi:GNAT family N-acetyltransferase [Pseudoduganella violaceinigra]|uniref:GNAT family N-acetyltransferase n=1 Tax=Pseudoduganella violaceinigra TaxID=246602 RepID=UPI0004265D9C|nr:GNAT family N-acetyltransferase [Pseudoduganella violaceinigra]
MSIVRALHDAGVEVYALEKDGGLPGVRSKAIRHTFLCSAAELADLVPTLAALRARLPQDRPVVLFPSNDTHVRLMGEGVAQLRPYYRLSWADCADHVLRLQRKNELEQAARSQGLNYPRSATLDAVAGAAAAVDGFRYPVILKPARPLSSFKTALAHSPAELRGLLLQYQADLPILAQEYIDGGDQSLYFGALVLDHGKVVQEMVGRKIASFPPARGQTTVAETVDEPAVLALTRQFFAGLALSGPVSLELKRAPDGSFWVIEPTVGRTDFWLELCVAAGFNQVYQEFQLALGLTPQPTALRGPVAWFDGERDILSYWKAAFAARSLRPYGGKRAAFTYWRPGDQGPFLRACRMGLAIHLRRRLSRLSGRQGQDLRVQEFSMDAALPAELSAWLRQHQPDPLFCSPEWYEALVRFERSAYPENADRIYSWLFVWRGAEPCLAVPIERRPGLLRSLDVRLLSNFYSPFVDLFADAQQLSQTEAWKVMLQALDQLDKSWLRLSAAPVCPLQAEVASAGARQCGHAVQQVQFSTNYSSHAYDQEGYWAKRPSQLRNTIKRKGKALTREAHRFEVVTAPSPQQVEDYWSTYQLSWKVREPSRCFIDWLMRWSAELGYLRLGLLYLDGRVVASQLWLVVGGVAHIFKLAQDRDADKFSPGSLLTGHLVDYVYQHDKVECIDFMLGDDPYKALWMEQEQPYYTLEVLNQRHLLAPVLRLYLAARGWLRPSRGEAADGIVATVP